MTQELNIISEIKQSINKNRSMVQDGVLGIMIDYFDTSKLKDIGKQCAKELHEAVVGKKPEYDTPEYKDWYERTMIFEQIMKGFGCYEPMDYLQAPAEYQLQNMLDRIDKKGYEWSDGRIRMKLPKTWEEFCEVYPLRKKEYYIDNTSNIREAYCGVDRRNSIVVKNLLPNKETAEAILALLQLIQLRDFYNDGWKPYWKDVWVTKYCIVSDEQTLKRNTYRTTSQILAFKSEELRDQFLENFRDLIEIAKPLI